MHANSKKVWKGRYKMLNLNKIWFHNFESVLRSLFASIILILTSPLLIAQIHPKTEMRAAWIATVANIDWPTTSNLTVEEQKMEMVQLLDRIKEYNLNTVVFQIRPSADAFYSSTIEPWAQWLNGVQGKAPEPFYDPLEFVIAECRKRGLDVHAWLNPYRAVTDTSNYVSPGHISKLHPEWFLTYGKTVYFDPGLPETRDYVAGVVADVVRRYDIDAIHMDDYFYPYRIAKVDFPDDSSFCNYPRRFAPDQLDDWRRDNVNLIIKQLSDSIKAIKPWVEFGISPFGVWRNIANDTLGSLTKAGQTNYDDLFADILLWQMNGWIDYITPQIYWHIGFKVADYKILSEWWSHNSFGCNLYIGQAPYRIARNANAKEWRTSREIIKEIKLNRTYPNVDGSMFFSAKVLLKNPLRFEQKLKKDLYRYNSLPPSNSRVTPVIPMPPGNRRMTERNDSIFLTWDKKNCTKKFVIYKLKHGKQADLTNPENIFQVTSDTSIIFPETSVTDLKKYYFVITSVSVTNILTLNIQH
jgi:uncharacterized lipoprotein YddW (UPF0748 family)